VELARRADREGGLLSEELRQELAVQAAAAARNRDEVLSSIEPSVEERHAAVDLDKVRQAAAELSTALLVDLGRPAEPAGTSGRG
jgi:predicted nucleotidyltransferase